MLHGYPEGRILSLLQPGDANKQKTYKRQKGSNRFRHLNVRIVKNNLAYPLVRDTISVLGNSRCEVLSVLDLKDAFHSLRLSENSRKYCGILPYFGSSSYLYHLYPIANGIKYFTIHMAVLYKFYFRLSAKQKVLQSNHG